MKKIVFLVLFFPLVTFSQEQTSNSPLAKGNFFIDGAGRIKFSSTRNKYKYAYGREQSHAYMEYIIQGGVGYFVEKNFAAGINFHMDNVYNWDGGWVLLGGPFIRMYLPVRAVNFFAQMGIYMGTEKQVAYDYETARLMSILYPMIFDFEVALGFAIPVNENVHFELLGAFNAYNESLSFKGYSYDESFQFVGLKFGITFIIPKKEK